MAAPCFQLAIKPPWLWMAPPPSCYVVFHISLVHNSVLHLTMYIRYTLSSCFTKDLHVNITPEMKRLTWFIEEERIFDMSKIFYFSDLLQWISNLVHFHRVCSNTHIPLQDTRTIDTFCSSIHQFWNSLTAFNTRGYIWGLVSILQLWTSEFIAANLPNVQISTRYLWY